MDPDAEPDTGVLRDASFSNLSAAKRKCILKCFFFFGYVTTLLLIGSGVYGQDKDRESIMRKVDSLKSRIDSASGIDRYRLIYGVAYELFDIDDHEAVKYAHQAHQMSWDTGDSLEITKSGRVFGQLLRRVDLPDSSILQFNKMLPIAERNHFLDEANRILNALGLTYSFKSVYDKALEFLFKLLKIAEEQNKERMVGTSFVNIGLVFYSMGNWEQALEFYTKALEIKTRTNDQRDLEILLINMSLCFTKFHDYEMAYEYVQKAYRICGNNCSDEIKMGGEISLGYALLESKQFDLAEKHFSIGYLISRERSDKLFQAENLYFWAVLKFMKHDYKEAERMFSETERLTSDGGYTGRLIDTYKRLIVLYNSTNDFEKEHSYTTKYFSLMDSIYNETVIKNVFRILSEYRERENKRKVADQEKLLLLQEATIGKQKLLNAFIGLIAILFIGLAFLLYRTGRYRKQISVELDKRVHERTKELVANRDELLRSHEERNALLETLSRKLNASLATFKGLGVIASKYNSPPPDEYPEKFEKIADQLTEVVRMVQKSKTRDSEDNTD